MKEIIYTFLQSESNRALMQLQICGTSYCDGTYRIDRPHSGCACLEYVAHGTGTVIADGRTFYPKAGDSYFLQCNQSHLYYSDAKTPWTKYFINLSGSLLEHMIDGYGLRGINDYPSLSTKAELLGILAAARRPGDPTEEVLGLLHRIFFKMHQHLLGSAAGNREADAIRAFLDLHIKKRFRLEDLCHYLKKSESQVIRIFKKEYGTTPYVYLMDQRIELAKQMLLGTVLSVRQIALELCFADEYYFSNFFKKKTGISPAKYRTSPRQDFTDTV